MSVRYIWESQTAIEGETLKPRDSKGWNPSAQPEGAWHPVSFQIETDGRRRVLWRRLVERDEGTD